MTGAGVAVGIVDTIVAVVCTFLAGSGRIIGNIVDGTLYEALIEGICDSK